jgi:hypothetical protein
MAKAASGRPSQPEHADVIEIAHYGVRSGLAEFAFSSASYTELLATAGHRSTRERRRVMPSPRR